MSDLANIQIRVDASELNQLNTSIDNTSAAYGSMVSRIVAENKRMELAVKASAAVQEEASKRLSQQQSSNSQDSWFAQQRRRIQMMEASARIEEQQAREQERLAQKEIRNNKAVLDSFVEKHNQEVAIHRRRLAMASERERMIERQLVQEARFSNAVTRSNIAQQRSAHGFSQFGQVVQQTGYQFGDFIVQVQSGTNAWVAAGQQATQMAGLLLIASNPVVLVLGAILSIVIPLATAYGAYASRTEEAVNKTVAFKDSLKDLLTTTEEIKLSIEALRLGVAEEEIESVLKINAAKREQQRIEAELLALYNGRNILATQEELERASALKQQLSVQRNIVLEQEDGLRWYRTAREELAKLRKAEEDAARAQEESQKLTEQLVENQLAAMQGLTKAIGAAKSQAASFVGVADSLASALGRAAAAWGVILSGPITGGPGARERYEASGSADAAARNNALTMGKDGGRLGFGALGVRNFSVGGSGGGGGGGGTNPLIAELESLQDFLRTEAELEIESYTERQETLRSALDQKLLTLQEYNQLEKELKMKHDEEMAQLDAYRYGNGLAVTKQWFGDMANAFQSGGERMARIGRVLNAAIALQNSYVAFTEVLKDPAFIGRPFARFAAASAILAQGLSAVAAIKGSSGGSGGSGGGSVGSIQSTRQASAQTVYISGLAPDALFTGEMLQELFNSFYKENDNRGKVFVVAR